MSLITRLAVVERRQGPSGPYAVLVHVLNDGTTVTVCHLGRPHEDMTLAAYHAAYPDGVGCVERWYILSDAEAQPDQQSARWRVRNRRLAGRR